MARAIAILIDPQGTEHYVAFGPHTTNRKEALRFLNTSVAIKAARNILFGDPTAFWESERRHNENTRREHKGWTYRIEEVTGE